MIYVYLADNYLLQVQEYTAPSTPKTDDAKSISSQVPSPEQTKWYDVDVVKGTQYTVTAYQVPVEDPTMVRSCLVYYL